MSDENNISNVQEEEKWERNRQDYDSLTGLYTSAAFYNAAKGMLKENIDKEYAMMFFNIRGFSHVEEIFGSEKTKEILKQMADVLQAGLQKKGICARIVRDTFVCLLACSEKGEELRYVRYVESSMKKMQRTYRFSLECGIYVVDDREVSVSIMCDRAKFAMINVHENFGQNHAYYDARIAERYQNERRLLDDMERALSERQFYVMFQPIYHSVTHKPVSAEALVRWKHPEMGIISPDIFVPLFEKNGYVRDLDLYVWEEVCRVQKRLQEENLSLPVSVNVSRLDLYNPGLADDIEKLLGKYGLSKHLLKLEITETAYVEKPKEIIALVFELKNRGFEIMMDDFGSGYSSLNMLKEMPIDTLKMDMRFMEELFSSQKAGTILVSIIKMAKMLKVGTVAEGVETKEQAEFLRNIGCERIQGYYFSKPLFQEEYIRLLEQAPETGKENEKYKKGILVVDDVKVLRKSLIASLGDTYRYYEAANGKEALEILKKNVSDISIVVTDIFMPEMNGFEFMEKLQEDSIFSHLPVIVITSSNDRENEIQALKLGAVDFVLKPYDEVIVCQRIRNVIELSELKWLRMEVKLLQEKNKNQEKEGQM